MNCAELDILLCDYVDGTLPAAQKALVEEHLEQCASCAQLARDAAAAVNFMATAAPVEPPPELVTHILFEMRSGRHAVAERKTGLRKWLGPVFEPILQPRFAMGMAMTILSFSMLGRFAGMEIRQLRPADLNPTKVWATVDDKAHRTWERAVKFYENLRLVYEVQSRLRDWVQVDDSNRKPEATGKTQSPANEGATGPMPQQDLGNGQRGNAREAGKQ